MYHEKAQWDNLMNCSWQFNIPKIIIDSAIRYHKQFQRKTFRGLNEELLPLLLHSCSVNKYQSYEIAQIFNLDNTSAIKVAKMQ